LIEQARQCGARAVAVAVPASSGAVDLPASVGVYHGATAAETLIREHAQSGDLVVAAIVGFAGIAPVLAAIDAGCDIALANKEALVAAGSLVTARAKARGVSIIPVDSEHSAIAQCLRAGGSIVEVQRIVLTASGGPFRTATPEAIDRATLADALRHPTWSMGQKVTIDSATMMNKGLEIVEAHWLFGLEAERIDAIVHPQSIVHSFVEFRDGSVIAQLSPPDMRLPIQCALTWPARAEGCCARMGWSALSGLHFEPVDHARFPAVELALRVVREGGTSGAVFNGANEAAVGEFVQGRVRFGQIPRLVAEAIDAIPHSRVLSLADVAAADAHARRFVHEMASRARTQGTPAAS
jgi:1-deoxy-D-xylulose-5-phosphate reductoisomerase